MWLLKEGGSKVEEVNFSGCTALICAAQYGELKTVKWLLKEGRASIGDVNNDGDSALILAASFGQLETVKWLLEEGGASIEEANHRGRTALLAAANCGELATVQYLLEHGGADIGDTLRDGDTIWDLLEEYLIEGGRVPDRHGDEPYVYDATAVISLLRVMVLRGAPPAELTARLSPEHAQVVKYGARLRTGLPAYLARRRVLLDAHCPLIPPLRALVHGYEEPTTTDELWATGLGAARQRAVRPRADDDAAAAAPLRRFLRLRQKRE
jgi:cellobiose-specific phosphotransferase system component IIA